MASVNKNWSEKRDDSGKSEILHRLKTRPLLFIGTVLVLVIVIIAFVFVPAIVPESGGGGDRTFGYYNKVPITYVRDNYFYQVHQSLSRNQQTSGDDPNYIFQTYQVWKQAFQETVIRMGMLDEMKQANYKTPEDVVNRNVAELEIFSENGHFSAAKYRALDKTTQLSLWRQIQENTAVEFFMSDFSSLKVTEKELEFISSMGSPQRSFDIAIFPFSSFPDSEVARYADNNSALFTIIHLSKITLPGEREARQVLDSVRNGVSTFEEAARTNSQDEYADRGGDMGIRMGYELAYDIADMDERERVVSLARGELSDLVKVPSGWAFYRAEETSYPADISDPLQKEKIGNYIMTNARGQVEDWLISEAQRFSAYAEEKGFDEAVYSLEGVTKNSFGPIPVNYGNSQLFSSVSSSGVGELASAATNQFFWRAAFSTPLNSYSDPVVVANNVIVLLPREESEVDDDEKGYIKMYIPYWINDGAYKAYNSYFLSNDKLDDRFDELFWKLWSFN